MKKKYYYFVWYNTICGKSVVHKVSAAIIAIDSRTKSLLILVNTRNVWPWQKLYKTQNHFSHRLSDTLRSRFPKQLLKYLSEKKFQTERCTNDLYLTQCKLKNSNSSDPELTSVAQVSVDFIRDVSASCCRHFITVQLLSYPLVFSWTKLSISYKIYTFKAKEITTLLIILIQH